MPSNRKRVSRKKIPATPEWQLEYLRTGHIEVAPVFEGLPETQWPDIEPNPWDAIWFTGKPAEKLWQDLKASGANLDDFQFGGKHYEKLR